MPGGVLVIGVGGVGRGIVNHLKWRLEELYGSVEKAGTTLYVIDGPSSDEKNEVPGGFQISVGPGSHEKYEFRSDPTSTLASLAGGVPVPRISNWLSQADAMNTPRDGINPNDGFGGVRVPGRITFFTEVERIVGEISRLLSETKTFFDRAKERDEYSEVERSREPGARHQS